MPSKLLPATSPIAVTPDSIASSLLFRFSCNAIPCVCAIRRFASALLLASTPLSNILFKFIKLAVVLPIIPACALVSSVGNPFTKMSLAKSPKPAASACFSCSSTICLSSSLSPIMYARTLPSRILASSSFCISSFCLPVSLLSVSNDFANSAVRAFLVASVISLRLKLIASILAINACASAMSSYSNPSLRRSLPKSLTRNCSSCFIKAAAP